MAEAPKEETTDNFVEIEGVKYQQDPDKEGQALLGEDGNFVPYKESGEAPVETEEEKKARVEEESAEPHVRRSAKDHIIARQTKTIKKLKKEPEEGGGDVPLGEEVTEDGRKAIKKAVEEATGPLLDTFRSSSDDQELESLFRKYPEAKEMEKQIRKHMEVYKNAPVEFIYNGLVANKMRLQTKRKKADVEAKKDVTGGNAKPREKDAGKIKDVRGMGGKDFAEHKKEVMRNMGQ